MTHQLLHGRELVKEADRLATVTLIPGNVYSQDVLDKIALAKHCVEARALLQHVVDKLRPYQHQLMMQFLADELAAFLHPSK